jgi:nucleotide-binding universal stress UspA family protein
MAFTHVLVPTDFSDPANQALGYALEEATLHRAKVTLLHVLAPTPTRTSTTSPAPRSRHPGQASIR